MIVNILQCSHKRWQHTRTHTPQPCLRYHSNQSRIIEVFVLLFLRHWVLCVFLEEACVCVCVWESLPFLPPCLSGQVSGEWQACGSTTWVDLQLFSFDFSCSVCEFLAPTVADLTFLKAIISLSGWWWLCLFVLTCLSLLCFIFLLYKKSEVMSNNLTKILANKCNVAFTFLNETAVFKVYLRWQPEEEQSRQKSDK